MKEKINLSKTVYLKNNRYKIIDKNSLKKLIQFGKKKNVSRYCLHKSIKDKHQEMVIWQKKGYFYPIKKNIKSDQTFVILSGSLKILIFDVNGKIVKTIYLNTRKNLIARIKKNTYFCDISLSNKTIHLETKNGSFSKNNNVFAIVII